MHAFGRFVGSALLLGLAWVGALLLFSLLSLILRTIASHLF